MTKQAIDQEIIRTAMDTAEFCDRCLFLDLSPRTLMLLADNIAKAIVHDREMRRSNSVVAKNATCKQRLQVSAEALGAKLEAAEKALEIYMSAVKNVCESQRGTKWGKAAECIFDAIERAVLGGKP